MRPAWPRWSAAWPWLAGAALLTMFLSAIPDPGGSLGIMAYLVPVILSTALLVISVARIPGPRRAPWALLAVGMGTFLLGELISARYELVESDAWPNPAEVPYIVGQLAMAGGVLWINRRRSTMTYRGDVLDSAIVGCSAAVLSVVFFVLPLVDDSSLGLLAKVVSSAYPIIDVLIIYLVVRMITTPAGRAPAYWLLLASQVATLAADTGWNALQLTTGAEEYPRWVNLLWLSCYLLLALAAHRASVDPETDESPQDPQESRGVGVLRLVVLTVASLMPAVILVVLTATDRLAHVGWLGTGSILLGILVTARMWDLLEQLRGQTAEVARLARLDPLTGLPNRRTWDEHLLQARRPAAGAAGSCGDGAIRVVALLDLDSFKAYNDRHGHQAGDDLLQAAADAWTAALAGRGFLARWGGEEFAVLLNAPRAEDALATLEQLRAAVPNNQTCSVGAAVWPDEIAGPQELLNLADQALYAAKSAGRNRVVLTPSPDAPQVPSPRPALDGATAGMP